MLHVRLNLITADPSGLGECLRYIGTQVRPAVERQPGNLGLSLLASPEPAAAIFQSFWASHEALQVSEQAEATLRRELERRAAGPVAVEPYRIPVFEHEGATLGGEAVRLTRVEVKRSAVDDVIEIFGDTAVPWLAETPGFRSALLFADPDAGQLVSETTWRDPQARAASPSVAAVIRADSLAAANCEIRAIEDYRLVFSSARKD